MDRLRPWLRRSGWAYLLLAIALAALAWRIAARDSVPTQPPVAAIRPEETATTRTAKRSLLIHVAGAVRKPGLYRIDDGERVRGAIRRAGGATAAANLDSLNLAAAVADGQKILVPSRNPSRLGVAGTPTADGGPVSLSAASAAQLDELDGIGPTLAARIVSWRDEHGGFTTVDQLLDVPGIGQARMEALRTKVTP